MTRARAGALLLLVAGVAAAAAIALWRPDRSFTATSRTPVEIPATGPIVVALAGDLFVTSPIAETDADVHRAFELVRSATLGFANLESVLLDPGRAAEVEARPAPRWPSGHASQANELRDLGVNLVSLANNHAIDFGPDGLQATQSSLAAAGIVHAGAGADLAAARAPVFTGRGARRVALIAVTTLAVPETAASASQTDIRGRPGVNRLGYTANITADPATFETLKQSVVQLNAGPPPGERELTMFGARIAKGERTSVDFVMNEADERAILDEVRAARAGTEFVIVSVHSHEPLNGSEQPADFVRRFAHDAVDAGARLVVGHGPHRLRGAEIYKGAAILYSLGNFVYQTGGLDFRAADPFDAGRDLFGAVLGTQPGSEPPGAQLEQEAWWEGLVALVTLEPDGRSIGRLVAVDLGVGRPLAERGLPRLALGERNSAILRRFASLSAGAGLTTRQEREGLVVEWSIP